jgi:glycosyltransferase involved in cell wall biosynthesis
MVTMVCPRAEFTISCPRTDVDREALWGCDIDEPAPGARLEGHGVTIAGWVLGRRAPVVAVELVHRGQVFRRVPMNDRRPDLLAHYPYAPDTERSGFRTSLSPVGLSRLEIEVQAVLQDQRRVPIGSVHVQRRWCGSGDVSTAPLISVVIPCYNHARFLGEAIESVLAQTYPHLEVIVVDDGSTDNTPAVAARYPGVRYLRQPNCGRSAAANTGLRCSGGSYLVFLDADDRLLPSGLETGLLNLEADPRCAFVVGHVELISGDGTLLGTPAQHCPTRDHYLSLLMANYIWTPGVVMYRRSILESVGGFDKSVEPSDDFDLNVRIAKFYPMLCHGKPVLQYRQHSQNWSGNPLVMLRSSVKARRRELRRVRGRERLEVAVRKGITRVQDYYGERVVVDLHSRIHAREWTLVARGIVALARWHPRGFGALALLELAGGPAGGWTSRALVQSIACRAAGGRRRPNSGSGSDGRCDSRSGFRQDEARSTLTGGDLPPIER